MKNCPSCSLLNPATAIVCDCGHVLDGEAARSLPAAHLHPPESPRRHEPPAGPLTKFGIGAGGFFVGGFVQGMVNVLLGVEGRLQTGTQLSAGITGVVLALHLLKHFEAPPAAARRAPDRGRNYLSRHWRGELPLGISYWVNGWLAEVVGLCAIALLSRSGARLEPPYARLLPWIAAWVITGSAAIWYWVGTWRSSDRPNAAGWISSWSGVAKFGVIVGAIACVAAFTAGGWPALQALLAEARR